MTTSNEGDGFSIATTTAWVVPKLDGADGASLTIEVRPAFGPGTFGDVLVTIHDGRAAMSTVVNAALLVDLVGRTAFGRTSPVGPFVDLEGVAELAGLSYETVRTYRSRPSAGLPAPARSFGRTPVWRVADVLNWIESRSVPSGVDTTTDG